MTIDDMLRDMSPDQKVGQVVLAGFEGHTPSAELRTLIDDYHLGGTILFQRNYPTTRVGPVGSAGAEVTDADVDAAVAVGELLNSAQRIALQSATGIPLLVWWDLESGLVTRAPANMCLGALDDEALTERFGEMLGRQARALGVHIPSVPVLDVNVNSRNPVIHTRSFSEDPARVARLGVALTRGLQAAGVLAQIKHFPGHGDTAVDSHLGVPSVPHDRERLEAVELKPFRAAADAGAAAICTAHVLFPALEPGPDTVATGSRAILTNLLRESMNFEGLICSDCLTMQGIAMTVGTEQGLVEFINAGGDLAAICHQFDVQVAAIEELRRAVRTGRVAMTRLDDAVRRVLTAKQRLGLFRTPLVDLAAARADLCRPADVELTRHITRGAVTVLCAAPDLPLQLQPSEQLVVFCPATAAPLGDACREFHANTRVVTAAEFDPACLRGADMLIAACWQGNWPAGPGLDAAALAQALPARQRAVFVLRSPYDLAALPADSPALTAYGFTETSCRALASSIFGAHQPTGTCPVTVPVSPSPTVTD